MLFPLPLPRWDEHRGNAGFANYEIVSEHTGVKAPLSWSRFLYCCANLTHFGRTQRSSYDLLHDKYYNFKSDNNLSNLFCPKYEYHLNMKTYTVLNIL